MVWEGHCNPCSEVHCESPKECHVVRVPEKNNTRVPKCMCNTECPKTQADEQIKYVCASNGKTVTNHSNS